MAKARFFAEFWVKLPEICPCPPKLVKEVWVGWIRGADWMTPSSSMASSWWKLARATASHLGLPEPVKV